MSEKKEETREVFPANPSDTQILDLYRDVLRRYFSIRKNAKDASEKLGEAVFNREKMTTRDANDVKAFGLQMEHVISAMKELYDADVANQKTQLSVARDPIIRPED